MTITCDVIKYAYRQSKDGFIVSFVVHPQEMPAELANADIGSQWQLSLVALDEHGNARLRDSQDAAEVRTAAGETELQPSAWDGSVSLPKQRKPVAPEKRLVIQAALCCSDPLFQRFMVECRHVYTAHTDEVVQAVRKLCHVASRSEIIPATPAGDAWEKLHAQFLGWRDHDMPAGEAA